MQAGDAARGVVDTVALESAVAEDLPGHAGEDTLDAGADLPVERVALPLPAGQVFTFAPAVGHDESGAGIAAVGISRSAEELAELLRARRNQPYAEYMVEQ